MIATARPGCAYPRLPFGAGLDGFPEINVEQSVWPNASWMSVPTVSRQRCLRLSGSFSPALSACLSFGSEGDGTTMTLYATVGERVVAELMMRAEKPAFALDPGGADAPFVGYSLTRLAVEGTVDQGGGEMPVEGTAWFDHLWGELPVPGAGPVAWDRMQLQLNDGTDINAVRSRRIDGKGASAVSVAIFDPSGAATPLDGDTIQMTASRTWRHPSTGAHYPIEWRISGPDLDISIEPLTDDQVHDFSAPLWSGFVRAEGRRAETPVSGFGTLQLSGYGP